MNRRWLMDRLTALLPKNLSVREVQTARLMGVGVLVGVVGGAAAGSLNHAIRFMGRLSLSGQDPSVTAVPWPAVLLAPVAGGLLAAMVIRWGTRDGRPRGISDVIDATWNRAGAMSLRDGLASALAAASVVGSGQSGGREGPVVQLSSAVASWICRRLGIGPAHMRVLVASGAAAGIAASFNTPVGAAFFAMEVVLGNFAMRMFGPIVAATVTGTVVGQALLGDDIALTLPPFILRNPAELLLYALLGAVCGGVAVLFKRLIALGERGWAPIKVPPLLRPAVAGLATGLLALVGLNEVMGNGYGFVEGLLSDRLTLPIGTLVMILLAKVVATIFMSTSKGGAGLFAPTLVIGAITGTLFGEAVHALIPGFAESAGAYGMVGMGAVSAAVAHAPLTMALMLFELTGNYEVILPQLLALAVAGLVARMLGSQSEYRAALARRGITADRTREELIMVDLKVKELMVKEDPPLISADAPFAELAQMLLQRRDEIVVVLDGEQRMMGTVHLHDVKTLLPGAPPGLRARDVTTRDQVSLSPDQTVADALPLFFRTDMDELPVLDDAGRVVGMLWERDVVGAYHNEVLRSEDLLARVESVLDGTRERSFFELPPGQVMRSVPISAGMTDQTLRDLHLTKRYGCTVLAILREDGRTGRPIRHIPDADHVLVAGDRIVIVGPPNEIDALIAGTQEDPTEALSPVDHPMAATGPRLPPTEE